VRPATASVELAVTGPLLAFFFIIALDFSRVFYYKMTLIQCARNGALYGSNLRSYQESTWTSPYSTANPPSDDNIKAVVVADGSSLSPALTTSQVTVTHDNGSDGNAAVQVTVNYTFTTITTIPFVGTQMSLQTKCSMRVAQ
jgi:hypothetical protein